MSAWSRQERESNEVVDSGTVRSWTASHKGMVLLSPREGGAQAANGGLIRFGDEGFKAHYVENTDGKLLMMAVRFMCSADVTENSDLLALNSFEEMGTEHHIRGSFS